MNCVFLTRRFTSKSQAIVNFKAVILEETRKATKIINLVDNRSHGLLSTKPDWHPLNRVVR